MTVQTIASPLFLGEEIKCPIDPSQSWAVLNTLYINIFTVLIATLYLNTFLNMYLITVFKNF